MITTPAERARVDSFVHAIRRSADCSPLCHPTEPLPVVVAYASTRPEADRPHLLSRIPGEVLVGALVGLLLALAVILGGSTGQAISVPTPAVSQLDTADREADARPMQERTR
jgi:hypothetical protein